MPISTWLTVFSKMYNILQTYSFVTFSQNITTDTQTSTGFSPMTLQISHLWLWRFFLPTPLQVSLLWVYIFKTVVLLLNLCDAYDINIKNFMNLAHFDIAKRCAKFVAILLLKLFRHFASNKNLMDTFLYVLSALHWEKFTWRLLPCPYCREIPMFLLGENLREILLEETS